jgi:hypothetical protein
MSFSKDIPLEKLTRISSGEATLLWEERIINVDQLADSSVEDLYRKTRISPVHLQALVGRALLWKHVIGIEQMIMILEREEKNKSSERDKLIFQFPDIQSLCSYMFPSGQDGNIEVPQLPPNDTQFQKWKETLGIPEEILRMVVARISYFNERLKPPRLLEDEAGKVLQEEIYEIESRIKRVRSATESPQ